MKFTPIIRTFPGGLPATGKAYTVKREADDSTLGSGTTDSDGQFTYTANLSPGPTYWTATDTSTDPNSVRKGSSISTGSGGAYSLAEVPIALRVLGNGVIRGYLNEMACTDPGTAKKISYGTGAAIVNGIPAVIYTAGDYTATTSTDATNTKACYLVLEVTGLGQAEEGKVVMKDVCGSAAASPSLPTLTQTEATYQFPLYTFILGVTGASNANSITTLTSVRTFASTNPTVLSGARREVPTAAVSVTSTTGSSVTWTDGSTSTTLLDGVTYDISAYATLLCRAPSGQTISIAPFINGTSNVSTYISTNVSADYVLLSNHSALPGVVGTGAAITNGLRVKVSSGTGSYLTGSILFTAVPRQ